MGENAKRLRQFKNLTQPQLAQKLGVNVGTIARFEKGKEPSASTIMAYSKYFGVTTDVVFDIEELSFF